MNRYLYWGFLSLTAYSTTAWACPPTTKDEKVMVMVEGFHYLPDRFQVMEYRVNYCVGGSVDFGGSGGGTNCCLYLPAKWNRGIKVDVRWMVWDWSKSSVEELKNADRTHARLEGIYRAIVPIEYYSDIGGLDVHFFPGGRVRVIAGDEPRPIRRYELVEIAKATKGHRVSALYTKAELDRADKRKEAFRKKYGDWR